MVGPESLNLAAERATGFGLQSQRLPKRVKWRFAKSKVFEPTGTGKDVYGSGPDPKAQLL
jgi:hypothetical protein